MKELEMKNCNIVSIENQHKLPALPLRNWIKVNMLQTKKNYLLIKLK